LTDRKLTMSTPAEESDAQVEFPEDGNKTSTVEPSFDSAKYEQDVNEAVNSMKFNDDGDWTIPDGMTPEMQYAVNSERRRRDTQATFTKSQQALKVAESKTTALTEQLESSIRPNLTVEQAEELEDLKESDPDKWRAKLNEYDSEAYGKYEEMLEDIDSTANQETELERRKGILEQFISDNPELKLNDYVFENDLPPRITGKLSKGEATFEEFLAEAKEYLSKGKKIATENPGEEEPDLNKSSGTSTATDEAVKADAADSYKNEIF